MNEKEKITLDDFFKSGNVQPIKNLDDIDKNKDHYLYVGTNWCQFSRMGTGQFAEACGAKKDDGENDRLCYGLDLAKEGGREVSMGLGLPNFRGVPATVKWDANEQKYEKIVSGMKMTPELDKLFESLENGGL